MFDFILLGRGLLRGRLLFALACVSARARQFRITMWCGNAGVGRDSMPLGMGHRSQRVDGGEWGHCCLYQQDGQLGDNSRLLKVAGCGAAGVEGGGGGGWVSTKA